MQKKSGIKHGQKASASASVGKRPRYTFEEEEEVDDDDYEEEEPSRHGARCEPPPSARATGCGGKRLRPGKDDEDESRFGWWDSDALSLDCGICYMPFEAEIFMCNNGHAACTKCCVRINRKCWCCDEPIGDVRCRPLENVLAEMNTFCRFKKYGCGETVRYADRRGHEEACPRAPHGCPVAGCTYRGLLLYQHVLEVHADAVAKISYLRSSTVTLHKAAPSRMLVQAGSGRVFALLNGGSVLGGRSLSLVCVGPRPEGGAELSYKMEVRRGAGGGEPGVLSLAGTVSCARRLEEAPEAKSFLFVPNAFWAPSGTVSVSVRIG